MQVQPQTAHGPYSATLHSPLPMLGPTLPQCLQDDDIPGIVRYHTYEVLQKEVDNPRVK